MALVGVLRSLGSLAKPSISGLTSLCALQLNGLSFTQGFASETQSLSRKDVVYLLDNRDDPDVDAGIKAFLKDQYASGKAATPQREETYELTSQIEKKYVAAQIVEYGIQNIAVPLSSGKDTVPVKRYIAELLNLGKKAGFEDPVSELHKRLADQASKAESVRDFLGRIQPYMSAEFHAALLDALAQVEAQTNATVTLDSNSAGYKKFAEKVKAVATAHKLPWKLLLDAKQPAADEDAHDKARKDYELWLQNARVADATAELEVYKAEAAALLDKHLTKTAEQVRKEQQDKLAALQRRLEGAKGAKWAQQFLEDLKQVHTFDSLVAADPAVGPKAVAAA